MVLSRGERRDASCSPKGWSGVIAFTDLCNDLDITYYLSSLVKTCCRGGGC